MRETHHKAVVMTQRVYVCTNLREATGQPSCAGRGRVKLIEGLEAGIKRRGLDIEVKSSVCFGHCDKGPNVKMTGKAFNHAFSEEQIDEFLDSLG